MHCSYKLDTYNFLELNVRESQELTMKNMQMEIMEIKLVYPPHLLLLKIPKKVTVTNAPCQYSLVTVLRKHISEHILVKML